MVGSKSFWSSVFLGAFAVATAACSGNIGEPSGEEFDRLAQSKENLLRPVDAAKELLITDPSVIDAPVETTFDPSQPSGWSQNGAWSFGRLIHNMLPAGKRDSAKVASEFVFHWLGTWEADQSPNPLVTKAAKRTNVRARVIDPWKAASGCATSAPDSACTLDMGKAPFKLVAIVNRPDLRRPASPGVHPTGGEGRFVFNLTIDGKPVKETVIFEYTLPVWTEAGTLTWAYRWHLLGAFPFGSTYNALLRYVTNGFAGPGSDPRLPNGSALSQLRTNELVLVHQAGCHPDGSVLPSGLCRAADPAPKSWELREFRINRHSRKLEPHPVAQEPSRDFDVLPRSTALSPIGTGTRSAELAQFLIDNAAAITAGKHKVPAAWLANSSFVGSGAPAWGSGGTFTNSAGAAADPLVVRAFARETCAGCHRHESFPSTGAAAPPTFLHLAAKAALDPAESNDRAEIAKPGTGTIVSDFLAKEIAPGGPRFNDFTAVLNSLSDRIPRFLGHKVCKSDTELD